MAIRMRRGNEADFDPSKMLPGEWAVSTDTKYVRMCFSPGIVLRMATYEAFESDMAEIRKILLECQSIQTAVKLIQQNVTNSELVIENYVKEAKQYRDEAEQFRNEASMFAPEGYEDLVKNVSDNTVKIDTIIEKAELNIKNNAKGSNIHLTDSADSNVVALELYGKTEQNAYTGKNLFDCSGLTETTTNGVTFTPVYDANGSLECINVNGTANALVTYQVANKTKITEQLSRYIGEKIITSGCPSGGSTDTYYFNFQGAVWDGVGAMDTGNGIECTLSDFTGFNTVQIYLVIKGGFTANNLKFYPMVRLASTDETYEPYVGGMPSPSPSYPQEIKSVKGKNELDCRGLVKETSNGITYTPVYDEDNHLLYVEADGESNGESTYIVAINSRTLANFKSGRYILNGCPSGGSLESYRLQFWNYNGFGNATVDIGTGTEFEFKVSSDSDITDYNVAIRIASGITVSNLRFYPMIRQASIKDDTYVPYGLLRIKTHGINQFDISAPTKENEILNSDGTFSTNTGFNSYRLKLTDTITISYEKDVNFDVLRYGLEIDGVITRYTISGTELTIQKDSADAVWISIGKTNAQKNIMINTGTIALPYQPYQSSEITLSEPIELNGFNGVYDVLTSDGVTRRFAEKRILSSDIADIRITSNGNYVYTHELSDVKIYGSCLCTHFVGIGYDDIVLNPNSQRCYIDSETKIIYFRDNLENLVFTDLENAKTFFDENEVYLLYELATPTTEELQSDFTALKTFYPETYVLNDADCDMSITYTADAKNYIDNKIALLTTAIYNNI